MKIGDTVQVFQLQGRKLIHEGEALVVSIEGDDQARVDFHDGDGPYERFIDPIGNSDQWRNIPQGYCDDWNAKNRPDCHNCAYRNDVPWSSHSWCSHPNVSREAVHFITRKGGGVPKSNAPQMMNIECNDNGFKNGWFAWPVNFDPTWLTRCDGFEAIVVEDKAKDSK